MQLSHFSNNDSSCSDPSRAAAPVGQARTQAGPPETDMHASHFMACLTTTDPVSARPDEFEGDSALNKRDHKGALGSLVATSSITL